MGMEQLESHLRLWSNAERVLKKAECLVRKNLEGISSFKVYDVSSGCLSNKKYDMLLGYIRHALGAVSIYSCMYEPELLARRIVNKAYVTICPRPVDKTLGDSWRDQKNLFFANSEEDIRDFVMYFKSVAGILKVRELSDFEQEMESLMASIEYQTKRLRKSYEDFKKNEELRAQLQRLHGGEEI